MKVPRFLTGSRKTKITGLVALTLLLLYTIAGFLILPYYIKKTAVEELSAITGRRVSIEAVNVNPYALSLAIKGFEIKEDDEKTPFIAIQKLYVNAELMSVVKGGPVISEIRLEKPFVSLVRTAANMFNFSTIADRIASKPANTVQEKPGKPLFFSFNNIQIVDGNIRFDDRPVATKHEIARLNLSIPFISNLPSYVDSFVQPKLSAVINGTQLDIEGVSKVFADSHETSLDLVLTDIEIPYYLGYVPATLKVKVPSGRLDVQMKVSYRQYANRAPLLVLAGEIKVGNLRIMTIKPQEDFVTIPLFSVKDISVDLQTAKIEIGSVSTQKGSVSVARAADRTLNFASIMESPQPSSTPTKSASAPAAAPWAVSLKSFAVDDYTVKIADFVPAQPFGIAFDRINCSIKGFSTEKNTRGTVAFSMRVDHAGSVSIDGGLALDPMFADLEVGLNDLRLRALQPYLAEKAQVVLASGALSVSSHVTASTTSRTAMSASVTGKLKISKFALLDKANADDLVKWDVFSVDGIEVRTSPLFVRVRSIGLSNLYSRIIVNADRTLNLQKIMTAPVATAEATGPAQEAKPETASAAGGSTPAGRQPVIRIDTITLQNGAINFTDNSIQPRFSSNISEINGRISGLSSEQDATGEVDLKARHDRHAPLTIAGKVNPLGKDLFVDLKVDFKDMDLTSVSPYAGRYAGYAIEKGKLSFQLGYLIEKNKLSATNNVFIDQFTFGDAVESPEATKLPVKLAVALLKDRSGEIKLDIPVSGELNDPQFSIGGIILKVIVNLLVKAATSPFALLGAIFGGSEQLGYAEFDYGSAMLTQETKKKLDILEKALNDRPALKMDIIGHVDPEKDREGLKQNLLLKKVKAQKLSDPANKSEAADSLESMTVTPQEYPEYLKRAYKAEKFSKPRNAIGVAVDLPVPEMEKLMLNNLAVTDDDLKALAAERVREVRAQLLQSKRVEPERIFTIEPKTLAGDKTEGAKDSRVDFTLK